VRALTERVRALRLSLLQRASTITVDSPTEDIARVYSAYYYFKRALVREAGEPGEARELLRGIFTDPAFARFWSIRRRRYRQTDAYKERRRAYDRRRYQSRLKGARSTPEAKARLAKARREQRAGKRGATT
jgi:hypothetical protein